MLNINIGPGPYSLQPGSSSEESLPLLNRVSLDKSLPLPEPRWQLDAPV